MPTRNGVVPAEGRTLCDSCTHPCGLPVVSDHPTARIPLRTGTTLWSEGDPATYALVLCRGAAVGVSTSADGVEAVSGIFTRGQAVGLQDTLDSQVRSASVHVVVGGYGVAVTRLRLLESIFAGGGPALAVVQLSLRMIRASQRRVGELGYGSVEQRLARLLLQLTEIEGITDSEGILLPLQMSRTSLAMVLSCRPETMMRTLSAPGVREVIAFQREGVRILSLQGLRQLALPIARA